VFRVGRQLLASGFVSAAVMPRRGVSKATLVYDDLRASIIDLALKPGTQIDKQEICGRLGISRQPLAEAVARLATERLVDVEPQKGTYVARIRLSDVIEAAFVRRALEVAVAEASASAMDASAIGRIERNLAFQEAAVVAQDWNGFYALDVRFHEALSEGMGMRRLRTAIDAARAPLERARRLLLPAPGRSPDTLHEHRAIFEALKARNSERAGAAMATHLDKLVAEVRRLAARQPDLFEA